MNTAMMYKIAPAMNRAGFMVMDASATGQFEYAVRHLRDDLQAMRAAGPIKTEYSGAANLW